ncbi:hypothetical protein HDV63DRAFT_378797 [Trichoderma sp. SZMC 28014]
MSEGKLVVVIGATGKQGGSVARRFLAAGLRVRGVTRNPSSQAAKNLAAEGIEVVKADLDDVESLKLVFRNANIIFSVTNYWELLFRPDCREKATELGISPRQHAGNIEYQQGKNIVDAAATTTDSLDDNGFLVSTLSYATKCSEDRYTELYHFDAKAKIFPLYVKDEYPELAEKMSCIQTGFFFNSFNMFPDLYFKKLPDGGFEMNFATAPDRVVPHLDVIGDMGNFVFAVYQMPAGKEYMAASITCSWTEWMKVWGEVTGVSATYHQLAYDEMVAAFPDRECGIEAADMFSYSTDPGYDGGATLLTVADIRKHGIDCPMTGLREWAGQQEWSAILSKTP